MTKQPTATAFTRTQQSWAEFALGKVQAKINAREEGLRENGWSEDEMDRDDELIDLYDEALFFERYAEEMAKQREYIRSKYLGG